MEENMGVIEPVERDEADQPFDYVLLAETLLATPLAELAERERKVVDKALHRLAVSKPVFRGAEANLTIGQRMADSVARVGGSWAFIAGFAVFLCAWALWNASTGRAFDPYPFIFLNLLLSMLAAIQAPIIMMSQNRQAARDRVQAEQDFEINLKAELEIMALHAKLDRLRASEMEPGGSPTPAA
jgi:uncharacterized membrane protein